MSRDEGMTPEGIVASISVPAPFGGRLYVPAGLVTAIAATLRSFGEQERRRARAEALEIADREARYHTEAWQRAEGVCRLEEAAAADTATEIAARIRALAEQPPPKEQEHE